MENISQLSNEFNELAKELTEGWQNLKCYAPNSYKGRVAWTFRNTEKPKIEVERPIKPTKEVVAFFGLSLGIGTSTYTFYNNYYGYYNTTEFAVSGGLDFF